MMWALLSCQIYVILPLLSSFDINSTDCAFHKNIVNVIYQPKMFTYDWVTQFGAEEGECEKTLWYFSNPLNCLSLMSLQFPISQQSARKFLSPSYYDSNFVSIKYQTMINLCIKVDKHFRFWLALSPLSCMTF